ncbi:MAG: glycerol-3-phosphate 1-O-acyltransferase PlsY [Firmicutes bacterium]|nr:glycerol-3-phosphate 1-O-acyltransferase PlsY [Bacillota bacterium]
MNILLTIGAYLLGSFPSGYLVGKWLANKDIRQYGSGNTGATNALRVLGPKVGLITFLLDFFKGAFPCFLALHFHMPEWTLALTMIAVSLGHCYSAFLGFNGGKAVATTCGIYFIMDYRILVVFAIVFFILVFATGYVSLGSLSSSLAGTIFAVIFSPYGAWVKVAFLALVTIIFYRHSSNIGRLLRGEESSFKKKK